MRVTEAVHGRFNLGNHCIKGKLCYALAEAIWRVA
ncbi:hypothetical protein T07_7890 [Trichinella nelsoni]|uniref:Uncharacterized protein n=1 Tax=Trichinella nelsoni TaxID=6336 RepID=A0A0V0S7R3_9BILA|nr:hypothetical protein T07_7890 [Trichinella nelsoni]